jgi:hypothetical protein
MELDVPGTVATPAGWRTPSRALLDAAIARTLTALDTAGARPVQRRLARYYDADLDYAGASFVALPPIVADDLTVADLHATSLLSVEIGPAASRRLLDDGPAREALLAALRALRCDRLEDVAADDLAAMSRFYETVKAHLSRPGVAAPNRWVTASKLCARKRPALFPVRDGVVCRYLGLAGASASYQVDWLVFRALVTDPAVLAAVDRAVEATRAEAAGRHLVFDTVPLRLLDAALWTYAVAEGRSRA